MLLNNLPRLTGSQLLFMLDVLHFLYEFDAKNQSLTMEERIAGKEPMLPPWHNPCGFHFTTTSLHLQELLGLDINELLPSWIYGQRFRFLRDFLHANPAKIDGNPFSVNLLVVPEEKLGDPKRAELARLVLHSLYLVIKHGVLKEENLRGALAPSTVRPEPPVEPKTKLPAPPGVSAAPQPTPAPPDMLEIPTDLLPEELQEPEEPGDQMKKILTRNLKEKGLSTRLRRLLAKNRIRTIRNLVKKTESELIHIKGFGRKSLREVKEMLPEDLCLGMVFDDQGHIVTVRGHEAEIGQ